MRRELLNILAEFDLPVFLQGSLSADAPYPETFFTYWNDRTTDNAHYDNDAIAFDWQYTIYYYTLNENAAEMDGVFLQLRKKLKDNGWITSGVGYDVPTDEPTHVGRAIDAWYVQRNLIEEATTNANTK